MPESVTHCRSCGAPIIWSLTERGKRCPYDAQDGEIVMTTTKTGKEVRQSHFGTCPQAGGWTKKGKA